MNQLFRTSVAAGRLAVGVARIKCTPYLDSPLTRMVNFVTSRSLVNDRASGFPVGKLEMDETGGEKEIDFASIFRKKETTEEMTDHHKEISFDSECTGEVENFVTSRSLVNYSASEFSVGNLEMEGKKEIDFASIFRKKDTTDHDKDKEISFDSEFTGDVEKQYLKYLAKLEWRAFHDHVSDFPRKRSEAEKKVIFDRYVELYKRKYRSDEVKEKRYGNFKENLDYIDESNARTPKVCTFGISVCDDRVTPCKTGEAPKEWVEGDIFEVLGPAVPYYMLDDVMGDD